MICSCIQTCLKYTILHLLKRTRKKHWGLLGTSDRKYFNLPEIKMKKIMVGLLDLVQNHY